MVPFSSVWFSPSVMSDSLRPHGLQHARPPYPSPTPRVYSNSLNPWCHPTISSPVVPSPAFNLSQHLSSESVLRIRWPKYWSFSFSISPSNEHLGLISFLVGSPCSPRDSQESSPTPQFKSINSSALSFLYSYGYQGIKGGKDKLRDWDWHLYITVGKIDT